VAEPKTLRLRLLAIAGRLTRSGRRTQLRLDRRWPWAATVTAAVARCAPSPTPVDNTAPAATTRDHGDGPVAVRGDLLNEQVDHLPPDIDAFAVARHI
jgi:hypothetical protein